MGNKSWKDVAELTGIAAIVASLIFVGLQLRQSQEIAIAETFLSILSAENDATSGINENADLWARANSGEELSAAEYLIFTNLVATLDRTARLARTQLNRLGHESAADGQLVNFAIFLHQNPVARQNWVIQREVLDHYRIHLSGRTSDMASIVLSRLKELDRAQMPPGSN